MENRLILIFSLIAAIAAISTVIVATASFQQDKSSTGEIISAEQEGNEKIQDSINKMDQKQTALLELALTDFQPEIQYRVDFVNRENEPIKLYVEMENTGNRHTAVRNMWTVTGDYCTSEGQHWGGTGDGVFATTLTNLTKQNPIMEEKIVLPEHLFDNLEEKNSFLLMLELEMIPFTPSSGLVESLSVPRNTFLQFDHNEEKYPDWWMITLARTDYIRCDNDHSIWTHVNLNTTDIEHFNLWPK